MFYYTIGFSSGGASVNYTPWGVSPGLFSHGQINRKSLRLEGHGAIFGRSYPDGEFATVFASYINVSRRFRSTQTVRYHTYTFLRSLLFFSSIYYYVVRGQRKVSRLWHPSAIRWNAEKVDSVSSIYRCHVFSKV